VARAADLPGAAHLVLAEGVVHLDPASAVFEAMLEGWARQQRTRFLKWDSTIQPRLSLVRRLATFSNQYPWEWQPAEAEASRDDPESAFGRRIRHDQIRRVTGSSDESARSSCLSARVQVCQHRKPRPSGIFGVIW
jgi:hypothetical protein